MAPRKKEVNKRIQEASRGKILQAAFELFAKYGYAHTSTEMIAKKAKISKGLIYHYFKNKQDILRGVFNMLMAAWEAAMKPHEPLSPREFLKLMIDQSVIFITQQTDFNRLAISLSIQPDVLRELKKEVDQMKNLWLNMIIKVFKELGVKDPEAETYFLLTFLDGLGLDYMAFDDYPIKKIRNMLIKKYDL